MKQTIRRFLVTEVVIFFGAALVHFARQCVLRTGFGMSDGIMFNAKN
jgi:hypothetical protein